MTSEHEVAVTLDCLTRFIARLDGMHTISELETIRWKLKHLTGLSPDEKTLIQATVVFINTVIKEFTDDNP